MVCVVKLQELTNEVKAVSYQPEFGKLEPKHHPLQVDVIGVTKQEQLKFGIHQKIVDTCL